MSSIAIASECDDNQPGRISLVAHPASDFKTIHIGQADVEKNDVRLEGVKHPERQRAVRCHLTRLAVPREDLF